MYNTHWYSSVMQVRPDDLDLFRHVHSSRYIDYVLAARFDQMERCYGNPMQDYLDKGFAWVVHSCTIHYKRPLLLGESFTVWTSLQEVHDNSVVVAFRIDKLASGKRCCEGTFLYTMVSLDSGRAQLIPPWALERYKHRNQDE